MNDGIYRRLAPPDGLVRVVHTARGALLWVHAITLCALGALLCARLERWESPEVARAMGALFAALSLLASARGLRATRVELAYDATTGALRSRAGRATHEFRGPIDGLSVRVLDEGVAVLVDPQGVERSVRVALAAREALDALLTLARDPSGRARSAGSTARARLADAALLGCALCAIAVLLRCALR